RIKRLTREYFRLHQHQLKAQVDILLTIKQFSDDMPNEAIAQQLAMGFNLINDKIRKLKRR
ncbi:ribonuclease P protein component, partial [Mycobacterium tuberculosis]|nr:ribonuclease P protein component [Mycobacterium tuberculosis]